MAFPGTYNFNYYAGDTYSFIIEPKTSNGAVFDLTGYTPKFAIATARNTDAIVLSTDDAELTATVDAGNEFLTCTILPTPGGTLTGTTYYYDVQIDDGAGIIYTLLTGIITVTQDIS